MDTLNSPGLYSTDSADNLERRTNHAIFSNSQGDRSAAALHGNGCPAIEPRAAWRNHFRAHPQSRAQTPPARTRPEGYRDCSVPTAGSQQHTPTGWACCILRLVARQNARTISNTTRSVIQYLNNRSSLRAPSNLRTRFLICVEI